MYTVAETQPYLASAKAIGMNREEMENAINLVSSDPLSGDLIVGAGGCRKVRIAGRGKGKSGGYRVVTVFVAASGTVYLLAVLSKGSEGNFSDAQVNALYTVSKSLSSAAESIR